jgi:hypothetical protein
MANAAAGRLHGCNHRLPRKIAQLDGRNVALAQSGCAPIDFRDGRLGHLNRLRGVRWYPRRGSNTRPPD